MSVYLYMTPATMLTDIAKMTSTLTDLEIRQEQ